MAAATRPSVFPVSWAENATPGNILTPDNSFIGTGWPLSTTPPSRQRFNFVLNYAFNGLRYLSRRGIGDWDATENYLTADVVRASDGNLYEALQASTNKIPFSGVNLAFWMRLGNVPTAVQTSTASGTVNNLLITDKSIGLLSIAPSGGNLILTGIITPGNGHQITVINTHATNTVTLPSLSGSSGSGQQFQLPADMLLLQNMSITLKFFSDFGRWVGV